MNTTVVDYYGDVPILNVMNVAGYSVNINGKQRVFLFARDIAIGGGLVYTQTKTSIRNFPPKVEENGSDFSAKVEENTSYTYIKWDRVNEYAMDAMPDLIKHDNELQYLCQFPIHEYSYIPQELAYMILMRCTSKKAREFKVALAVDIIPTITNKAIEIMMQNQENYINYLNQVITRKDSKISSLNNIIKDHEQEITALKDGINLADIENLAVEYNVSPYKVQSILNDLGIYLIY